MSQTTAVEEHQQPEELSILLRETDVYEVGDQNRTKGHLYLGQAIHINTFAIINLWGENKLNELRPMLFRRENEGKSDGIRKMGTWSAH